MSYQTLLRESLVWLLLAVPEGIMMVFTGLGSLGVRRSGKAIAGVGFAVGTASVLSRVVFPAGYHVPMVLLVYTILVVLVLKVSVKTAVLACFISSLLVNLGQLVVAFPVLRLTGLSVADTLANAGLHLAFGWAGETMLVIGTIYVRLKGHLLFPVPESRSSGGSTGR